MEKKRKYLIIFIGLSFVGLVLSYGISFAKYVSNSIWNYYLDAKAFYLDSPELTVDGKQNVNKLWDGNSVHFSIKNNRNKLLVTEYDISYEVTCTLKNASDGARCVLNGTDSNKYEGTLSSYESCINETNDNVDVSAFTKTECENKSYTWSLKAADKDMYFDVVGVSKGEDVTAEIRVVSTSPYKKTLTGEFLLKRADSFSDGVKTKYNRYSDYDELVISNASAEKKCLTIEWDSPNLRIDYDSDTINSFKKADTGQINSIDIAVADKDSVSYRFYKTDSKQYSEADFAIIERDSC